MPKHAPKGRIKGTGAPGTHLSNGLPIESRKCTAKSGRTGKPCKRWAIAGGTVCPTHGGSAPQVQLAAQARLMALQHPAIDTLQFLMEQRQTFPSTAYAAARDVLDRTEGKAIETVKQEHSGELVIRHELG